MLQTFNVTLLQMIKLFLFIFSGFILRKCRKNTAGLSSALSQVEVNICLPALCFSTFCAQFTRQSIATEKWMLLGGLALLAVSFVLALPLSRMFGHTAPEHDVYLYSFTVPNLAYLGYPIVSALWGQEMLCHFMMLTMPFNVFIYSVGMNLLNPKRTWSLKGLINPTMIALLLGMAIGISGIKLPAILMDTFDTAGSCLAPIAMILTGCVLGGLPLDRSFIGVRTLLATALRLLVLPLATLLIMRLLGISDLLVQCSVTLIAMPFGLNSVIFPEAFGGDSASGARLCFFSHLLSGLTVPVIISLLCSMLSIA